MRLRTGLRLLNRFFLTISSQEKQLSTSSSRNNIVREYKINIRISNFTIYPLSRPACMCASLICPQHRSRGLRMVQRLSSVNIFQTTFMEIPWSRPIKRRLKRVHQHAAMNILSIFDNVSRKHSNFICSIYGFLEVLCDTHWAIIAPGNVASTNSY